jgi:hypothetical protein
MIPSIRKAESRGRRFRVFFLDLAFRAATEAGFVGSFPSTGRCIAKAGRRKEFELDGHSKLGRRRMLSLKAPSLRELGLRVKSFKQIVIPYLVVNHNQVPCGLPARRAITVDPIKALRTE